MQDELDLMELIQIILGRIWVILGCILAGLTVGFVLSKFVIAPEFTSSALMYVNNTNRSNTENVNINDINASQRLVSTYMVILQSDQVLEEVLRNTQLPYTLKELKSMIDMQSVNNTEVMDITVVSKNPEHSAAIANAITGIAPSELIRVVKAGSVEVVNPATPAKRPSGPNVLIFTAVGGLLAAVLSVLFVLVLALLDQRIKGTEDLNKHYNIPILGEIPDIEAAPKGGYQTYG